MAGKRVASTLIQAFLFVLAFVGVNANNQPRITCSNQTLLIQENKPVGELLLTCTAYDPDNELVKFSAADDVTRSMVNFNTTNNSNTLTAHVFVKKEFDREGVQPGKISYVLTFRAEDPSQLAAEFKVNVYPSDVNDNPPLFSQPAYFFEINEGDYFGTQISGSMSITATDADSNGANPIFKFYLTPKGQLSSQYGNLISVKTETTNDIHKRIANIYVNGTVDYETLSFYQFDIMAKDIGQPPLNTTASLTIKVKDKQDMPPIFQGLPYIYDVYENIANWSKLLKISAEDGDRGIPRMVNYRIQSDDCGALFQVDTTTGEFHTISNLDREASNIQNISGICKVNITAYEIFNNGTAVNTPNSRSFTIATITILDEDDNPPAFNLTYVKANVSEGIVNSPITFENINGISVQDKDQGENSVFGLTLKYMNNTDIDKLEVLPKLIQGSGTVQVYVKNAFDYEIKNERHLNFKIVATSKANTSITAECQVSLSVLDVNDNDPEFENYPAEGYHVYIPENQMFGSNITVISAHDKDSEEFGRVSYAMKGSEKKFAINNETGVVTVACNCSESGLDADTRDTYYVTVEATDGGGRRSIASLQITLNDTNDNRPLFIYSEYETSWKENETVLGTANFKVHAQDNDKTSPNNQVRYTLHLPQNLDGNLTINNASGEIIVLEPLDYEKLEPPYSFINVTVEATDGGIPSLASNVTLIIHTQDINDNTPTFNHTLFEAYIYENKTEGHVITLTATDNDRGKPNNETTYYILKGAADRFRIDTSTGEVTVDTGARFDWFKQNRYDITIMTSDKGSPSLSSTGNLTVHVMDINNKPPKFNKTQFTGSVKENSPVPTTVLTVSAYDEDEDHDLRYSIINSTAVFFDGANNSTLKDYFTIDQHTGIITVQITPDRETTLTVTLTIQVVDNNATVGTQLDTAEVVITILDENDEAPVLHDLTKTSIKEDVPVGFPFSTVSATDVDSDSHINYTIISQSSDYFRISSKDNEATLYVKSQLDHEQHPVVNVTINACDGKQCGNKTYPVTIVDVNDNAPQFGELPLNVDVTEGNYTSDPCLVLHVNATDADSGNNSLITFSLKKDTDWTTGLFAIDPTSGEITVQNNLDREFKTPPQEHIDLVVVASDHGQPSRSSSSTISVHILDVNDNHPKFTSQSYVESFLENVNVGYEVLQVTATDVDKGLNGTDGITYSFSDATNSDVTTLFSLNNRTGTIVTAGRFENTDEHYTFDIQASDGGTPQLKSLTTVEVTVQDINNNAPVFHLSHKNFSMYECAKIGSLLTIINATDADKGDNAKLNYTFYEEDGLDPGPFIINIHSGIITLNGTLDSETHHTYYIKIQAEDNGIPERRKTISDRIQINVIDVNDNPPEFSDPTKTISFKENIANETVVTVKAIDKDSNPIISYEITAVSPINLDSFFHINKMRGDLIIIKSLDYESVKVVNITIEANDETLPTNGTTQCGTNVTHNNPGKGTNQTLIIQVIDENDNPPTFTKSSYQKGLRRRVEKGYTVWELSSLVTDKDSPPYNIPIFSAGAGTFTTNDSAIIKAMQSATCIDGSNAALCLVNDTITTNILFEEDMKGPMRLHIRASDMGGATNATLEIVLVRDSEICAILLNKGKNDVDAMKDLIIGHLTNITGYKFGYDNVESATREDGKPDMYKTNLFVYANDPKTGRLLTAAEIKSLIDQNAEFIFKKLPEIISITEFLQSAKKDESSILKTSYLLAGAVALEAILIVVVSYFFCSSKSKYERKLKAATVTQKAPIEEVSEKALLPGSNVYASMQNPLLNKQVPGECQVDFDRISISSKNSIDSNVVDSKKSKGAEVEEREAVMDMYGEDCYIADKELNPLDMVLAAHAKEKMDTKSMADSSDYYDDDNGDIELVPDEKQNGFHDNPAYNFDTTEV